MTTLSTATLNAQQVQSVKSLFSSFDREFYIKDSCDRSEFVVVYLYGYRDLTADYDSVITGWDCSTKKEGEGFDDFFDACKTELEKLTK